MFLNILSDSKYLINIYIKVFIKVVCCPQNYEIEKIVKSHPQNYEYTSHKTMTDSPQNYEFGPMKL